MMPVGSVLSYQCSLIPGDFNVYTNLPTVNEYGFKYLQFPNFPFSKTKYNIHLYTDKIRDTSKMSILNKLKVNNDEVISVESSTRNRPMIQNGLSTLKADLLHQYLIGLVAITRKHQRVLKH